MKFNEGQKNPAEFGRKNGEEIQTLLENKAAIHAAQEQGNGTVEDNVRLAEIDRRLQELGYSPTSS